MVGASYSWHRAVAFWCEDKTKFPGGTGVLKGHISSEMVGIRVPEATIGSMCDQNWTYAAMLERRL